VTTAARPDDAPLTRRRRVLLLVLPLVGLALAYVVAHLVAGGGWAREAVAAVGASLAGLGTSVIFGAAILGDGGFAHLSSVDLALIVFVFNTALTVIYVGAADLLERLPWAGPRLVLARRRARANAQHRPWIRRWAAVGVALFVISPLPGSGVVGGCVVGRVVGLSRVGAFTTVVVANLLVCVLYAWGASALALYMGKRDWPVGIRLAMLAGALLFLFLLLRFVTGTRRKVVT
jgi:uncharacterized membrane protein